jgi:hypothetical protein
MKRTLAYLLAAAGGAAAWVVACRTTGQAEAWDDVFYLQRALPALGGFALLLGFWLRERVGMLGIAASVGQIAGLAVTRGQHEMWPVDLAILSAQAVPFGICAWLGSGARRLLGGTFRVAGKGMRVATWPARRLLAGHRKSHPTPPELPTSRRDDHPAARRMFI